MIRVMALAGGVAGAATFSQYPEFAQQYTQRLAGQVDALTTVVMDFDTSALAAGLGREAALAEMTGSDFLVARQSDMRRTFARHAVTTRMRDPVGPGHETDYLGRMGWPSARSSR